MSRGAKNCRSLHMETIRLRRRYPASLAAALALLITMLVVYLLSVHALPKQDAAAMAQGQSSASLRLEGLECDFLLSGLHDDLTQARVAAARCSLDGGTGLVLPEGDRYAVVQEAGGDYASAEAPVIHRSAPGLTLEIEAVAPVIEAVSDGCGALRALATETGALAAAMDRGELDGRTLDALLNVYRTHGGGQRCYTHLRYRRPQPHAHGGNGGRSKNQADPRRGLCGMDQPDEQSDANGRHMSFLAILRARASMASSSVSAWLIRWRVRAMVS